MSSKLHCWPMRIPIKKLASSFVNAKGSLPSTSISDFISDLLV
jgi:hypothetical protein